MQLSESRTLLRPNPGPTTVFLQTLSSETAYGKVYFRLFGIFKGGWRNSDYPENGSCMNFRSAEKPYKAEKNLAETAQKPEV